MIAASNDLAGQVPRDALPESLHRSAVQRLLTATDAIVEPPSGRVWFGNHAEGPIERHGLLLVGAGLPEPELNIAINGPSGEFLARVDMLYRKYRVVVEYDGDQHRTDQSQFDRDLARLDDLTAHGWRVVRIGGRALFRDPQDVIARVRRALTAGGWTPDVKHPPDSQPHRST